MRVYVVHTLDGKTGETDAIGIFRFRKSAVERVLSDWPLAKILLDRGAPSAEDKIVFLAYDGWLDLYIEAFDSD